MLRTAGAWRRTCSANDRRAMRPLIRPSRWYYLLTVGLLVTAGLAGHRFHERRWSAVAAGLTQVAAPGRAQLSPPRSGHHSIFLEHRSILARTAFLTSGSAFS